MQTLLVWTAGFVTSYRNSYESLSDTLIRPTCLWNESIPEVRITESCHFLSSVVEPSVQPLRLSNLPEGPGHLPGEVEAHCIILPLMLLHVSVPIVAYGGCFVTFAPSAPSITIGTGWFTFIAFNVPLLACIASRSGLCRESLLALRWQCGDKGIRLVPDCIFLEINHVNHWERSRTSRPSPLIPQKQRSVADESRGLNAS